MKKFVLCVLVLSTLTCSFSKKDIKTATYKLAKRKEIKVAISNEIMKKLAEHKFDEVVHNEDGTVYIKLMRNGGSLMVSLDRGEKAITATDTSEMSLDDDKKEVAKIIARHFYGGTINAVFAVKNKKPSLKLPKGGFIPRLFVTFQGKERGKCLLGEIDYGKLTESMNQGINRYFRKDIKKIFKLNKYDMRAFSMAEKSKTKKSDKPDISELPTRLISIASNKQIVADDFHSCIAFGVGVGVVVIVIARKAGGSKAYLYKLLETYTDIARSDIDPDEKPPKPN